MVKPTLLALSIAAACPSIVYATDSLDTAGTAGFSDTTLRRTTKLQLEGFGSRV